LRRYKPTAESSWVMNALLAQGHGDDDHSAMIAFYEELSGPD
jgi:hypothetical protein